MTGWVGGGSKLWGGCDSSMWFVTSNQISIWQNDVNKASWTGKHTLKENAAELECILFADLQVPFWVCFQVGCNPKHENYLTRASCFVSSNYKISKKI